MIVVRNVFSLKFGMAKDAKALMKESKNIMDPDMVKNTRLLVDLVGPAYTLVMETTHKNLAAFEESMGMMPKPEWQEWYKRFIPLVDKSYREIFTVVE